MPLKINGLKGAFMGLMAIAVILVLAKANEGRIGLLENITNFLTSPPVWLCFRTQTPPFVANAALLIYGAFVGWALEWIFKERSRHRLFLAAAVLAGLMVLHRIAQIRLEGDLTATIKSLFGGLG